MAEAARYLFEGESVALETRHHIVVVAKPALFPLAGVFLLSAIPNRFTLVVLVGCLLRFAWSYALWFKDRFVLTDNRIISTSGLITTSVVSMPLSKITDLTYTRSIAGRILGYGKLHLESAGQDQLESIEFLPDPDHFYRCVMAFALGPTPEDSQELANEVEANRTNRKADIFDIEENLARHREESREQSASINLDRQHDDAQKAASSASFAAAAAAAGPQPRQQEPERSGQRYARETFAERRARIMAARKAED